jgi:hypothetical protein
MSTKLLDRILEISTNYFSKFPSIESVKVFGSRLVMGWTFTDPFTNSKKKVDVLWELEGGPKGKG